MPLVAPLSTITLGALSRAEPRFRDATREGKSLRELLLGVLLLLLLLSQLLLVFVLLLFLLNQQQRHKPPPPHSKLELVSHRGL